MKQKLVFVSVVALVGSLFGEVSEISSWRFTKDPSCKLDATSVGFDDSGWTQVRVPHDWAISGPFDKNPETRGGSGKLPWTGVGWYRTHLSVPANRFKDNVYAGAAYLTFDGVMANPQVWVNGQLAGGWDYGYMGFTLEVSKFLKPGENVVAVRADTRDHRSRWYPGAGIYRKVTFREKASEHVLPGSVFITTPSVTKDEATVRVSCEWAEAGPSNFAFTVKSPKLWDVDSPNLYALRLDGETYRYGIRSFAFTADDGFHLNGRRVQLRGVNLHSDLGLLGMAFDKSAMRRQLALMKDMGANALRTSHNPPAPEVLDLCDEMGIVVWDEAFDKWDGTAGRRNEQNLEAYVVRNLQAFVKRDRNHPCVVIWSISNEIWMGDQAAPANPGLTRDRCRFFRDMVRLVDSTRPVGNGNISDMAKRKFIDTEAFADLDVTGWNYCASYRAAKAKYPEKPVVYSESASALSTYGFYLPDFPTGTGNHDTNACQCTSYDGLGIDIPDAEFDRMGMDRYCAGEFVWTGIDYLGEPHPFWTQARSSYFGAVDLVGVPKDRFYLYRSHWNKAAKTLHVLPHWNWERKGQVVPVFVYTDAEEAELFVNGKSQGRRRKGDLPNEKFRQLHKGYYNVCAKYRLMWLDTVYEPGEVRVRAIRNGKPAETAIVRTAGKPVKIAVTPEKKLTGEADELLWAQVDVLDAKGVRNPLATDRVFFRLTGPGEILGVGNGDPRGDEAFTETKSHKLFFGKAVAVVRRTAPGELKLSVSAPGLEPAFAVLP